MSRARLSTQKVIETTAELIDLHGSDQVSLAMVAEQLGVRTPSLYSHVEGLEQLRRAVGLRALNQLDVACRNAAMGRSGPEALRAVLAAYRDEAIAHPGTYPLTQRARPDDPEWEQAGARVLEPLLVLLEGMGRKGASAIHDVRFLRSSLHGFVLLELQGGFGLRVSVERSFERLLDGVLAAF